MGEGVIEVTVPSLGVGRTIVVDLKRDEVLAGSVEVVVTTFVVGFAITVFVLAIFKVSKTTSFKVFRGH